MRMKRNINIILAIILLGAVSLVGYGLIEYYIGTNRILTSSEKTEALLAASKATAMFNRFAEEAWEGATPSGRLIGEEFREALRLGREAISQRHTKKGLVFIVIGFGIFIAVVIIWVLVAEKKGGNPTLLKEPPV